MSVDRKNRMKGERGMLRGLQFRDVKKGLTGDCEGPAREGEAEPGPSAVPRVT